MVSEPASAAFDEAGVAGHDEIDGGVGGAGGDRREAGGGDEGKGSLAALPPSGEDPVVGGGGIAEGERADGNCAPESSVTVRSAVMLRVEKLATASVPVATMELVQLVAVLQLPLALTFQVCRWWRRRCCGCGKLRLASVRSRATNLRGFLRIMFIFFPKCRFKIFA